jgi:nicotinic acid mononucleotide adenylyltransferase
MEEQIQEEQPVAQISSKEFAAKANSKREIYQLLTQEVRVYLPQHT